METRRGEGHLPTGRTLEPREVRMNPIVTHAADLLRTHTHPALRLGELADLVAKRFGRGVDALRLRALLEHHPDRFRLLEPWRGAWRLPEEAERAPAAAEAWVVAIEEPEPTTATPRTAVRLRESVRWLARGVDPRAHGEVSRWYAIVLSERAVREALVRRVA